MLILSHRGYHVVAPENTLAAFDVAAKLGVDGIETDLRLSADGQIVLYHDRLAPDGREVAALTRDELVRAAGYEVPTVEEALDAHPAWLWNLEIKTPAVVAAALPLLERRRRSHRLLVTSFWHDVVDEIRRRVDVPCGLLEANRPIELSPMAGVAAGAEKKLRPIETIVWSFEMLDPALLATARAAGIRNWCYGPHTPADHRRVVELQLDGVITDRPEYLLRQAAAAPRTADND